MSPNSKNAASGGKYTRHDLINHLVMPGKRYLPLLFTKALASVDITDLPADVRARLPLKSATILNFMKRL